MNDVEEETVETPVADEGGEITATEEHQTEDAQADEPAATPDTAKATPGMIPDQNKPTAEVKLVAYNDIVSAVREAVWQTFDRLNAGLSEDERQHVGIVRVYEGFGVVSVGLQHWRFSYTFENGVATISPKAEWEMVEMDWVTKMMEDATVVYPGTAVKAIGDPGDGWIGGFLIKYSDADHPDLVADFFDEATDYGPHETSLVFFNHATDPTLGYKTLGVKGGNGRWAEATLKQTDAGVWIQTQLDMRDEYERAVYYLAQQGKVGWSSGTAKHLVQRTLVNGKAYHIDTWPLGLDASITAVPAAGPMETAVVPLKSYQQRATSLKSLMAGLEVPDARKKSNPPGILEELNMTPEELLERIGEVVDTKLQPIATEVGEHTKTLEALKAAPATNKLPLDTTDEGEGTEAKADAFAKSFYVQQFGEPDTALKQVMGDIVGPNFEQTMFDMNRVFAKYIRFGERKLAAKEMNLLSRQLFSPTDIKQMLFNGLAVHEIKERMLRAQNLLTGIPLPPYVQDRFAKAMGSVKETMVTTQGQLGGYALTPMREDMIARLPGNTVVRSNGARVVNLINATSVDIPIYAGGDSRYRGAIRGAWGGEKARSQETNARLEMVSVAAHPYTFFVPMSRTMLMNAGNVVDLLSQDIIDTAAIDEDEAFVRGEGTGGKPLGIIPGGAFNQELEINRIEATAVNADDLIALSDALDDQYTERAIFVFRKSTGTLIRQLKDTTNDYLLRRGLAQGQPPTLLEHGYRRSEAMPAVAIGSCPILFADFTGYLIVQEPGLTVERFQDSNTGLGKVEFHVWRMLGGRVERPWMFAAYEIIP